MFPSMHVFEADQSYQYYITSEHQIITESSSLLDALIDVFATYFTFDMSYPPKLYPLMIFLQHYVLELKDEQRQPNNVKILVSSLLRNN